jgi:hypothetical protein
MSRKRELQRIKAYNRYTAYLGNDGSTLHKQSTGGCVRLELSNIFNFIATFSSLSSVVIARVSTYRTQQVY